MPLTNMMVFDFFLPIGNIMKKKLKAEVAEREIFNETPYLHYV